MGNSRVQRLNSWRVRRCACSVPEDEDTLALEGLLGLDHVFSEVLSIVADLGPHVVDEEWLSEVVFVVGVGHRLEVKSHGCTALNITDLEATSGRVAVGVEKLGETLSVLGEERVVESLLPFLIEVHHVVGLWAEKAAKLFVGEKLVEHVDLIEGRFSTLISDTSGSDAGSGEEMELPERSVSEHHECEATICNKCACPHVVGTMETGADLVKIVASAHSPFPVVRADHVGHVLELGWISLGLGSLSTVGSVVVGISADVVAVETLRGLEAHVVIAGLVVLSETEHGGWGKESLALLLRKLKTIISDEIGVL